MNNLKSICGILHVHLRINVDIKNIELANEVVVLDRVIGESGITLSGGEKQRLSLARALISPNDIILLDETTSNLDSINESKIQQLIKDLSGRKTVMDLEEAKVERATISMIQSMVEHRLLGAGYITIAEHYISYRLQRDLERSGYGDHIAVHLHFEQIR